MKKPSNKRKAKLLEAALNEEFGRSAKMMGLLVVIEHIFGEEVMKAIVAFNDNPTPDNKDKIREQLNLRFMETQSVDSSEERLEMQEETPDENA